jgi:hypothetical protein
MLSAAQPGEALSQVILYGLRKCGLSGWIRMEAFSCWIPVGLQVESIYPWVI